MYECSDYRSAGPNSCFFNKNDTSLWVNYNITVVATNAMGRSISEPVEVDVVYIGMSAIPFLKVTHNLDCVDRIFYISLLHCDLKDHL